MDSKSSKFWNVEVQGNTHTVSYGRTGTLGQSKTKTFDSAEAAEADAAKLIKSKMKKGYQEQAGSSAEAEQDGAIPLVAFSNIQRQDDVWSNAGTFVGLRVVDYNPEKKADPKVAYRFRTDWDEDNLIPHLEHFLATDAAPQSTALVIGAWHGDEPDLGPEKVIGCLVKNKERLPNLAALYMGDIVSEENEMSWINQCDLSPILAAFPSLQLLRSRGGEGLALASPKHSNLRGLAMEAGGLDVSVLRSVSTSDFPNLEYLELWLGTDDYGGNSGVADLQTLLSGNLFPKLKYLGLRNAEQADQIAAAVVNSPLVDRIETLDLSLGVLTDEAGEALLNLKSSTLKRLNLHYNYFTAPLIKKLGNLPFIVDTSKPSDMDDDEEWRFVAVGE